VTFGAGCLSLRCVAALLLTAGLGFVLLGCGSGGGATTTEDTLSMAQIQADAGAAGASLLPGATPSSSATTAVTLDASVAASADYSKMVLVGVGIAAEGNYIAVYYKCPPLLARALRQDNVYVVDEATGATYKAIPVVPVIGPLISRPQRDGQVAYVMLTNEAPYVAKGSLVTVVLGGFKQEHVKID
jgi:hypothetical protein